jgi:uncharacterized protein involved in exopolysaccharide biosynthesis
VRRYGYEANRVLRVLAVAVVLVAVCVTSASLMQTPTYKASALLLVGGQQEDQWINSGGSGEEMQTLEWVELPTQTMAHAIESRHVAEKAIQRLGLQMNPAELLDKLTVEQVTTRGSYASATKTPTRREPNGSSTRSARCPPSSSPKGAPPASN